MPRLGAARFGRAAGRFLARPEGACARWIARDFERRRGVVPLGMTP